MPHARSILRLRKENNLKILAGSLTLPSAARFTPKFKNPRSGFCSLRRLRGQLQSRRRKRCLFHPNAEVSVRRSRLALVAGLAEESFDGNRRLAASDLCLEILEDISTTRVAAVLVVAVLCFGDHLAIHMEGEPFTGPGMTAAANNDAVTLPFLKLGNPEALAN